MAEQSSGVSVSLQTTSATWIVDEEKRRLEEIFVCLENNSDEPVHLLLGSLRGSETVGATVLAASCLQSLLPSKCGGESSWRGGRILQPRPNIGATSRALTQWRALYLPPSSEDRISIPASALDASSDDSAEGSAAALTISCSSDVGAPTIDTAEVLLPLRPNLAAGLVNVGPIRRSYDCLVRFALPSGGGLRGESGLQDDLEHGSVIFEWIGRFQPRSKPSVRDAYRWWSSELISEPLVLTVVPFGANSTQLPLPPPAMPTQELTVESHSLGRPQDPPTEKLSMLTKPPKAPRMVVRFRRRRVSRPKNKCGESEQAADAAGGEGPSGGRALFRTVHGGTFGASESSSKRSRDTGVVALNRDGECAAPARQCLPPLVQTKSPAQSSDVEHGTKWRNVSRKQDPLADPVLLEIAEIILAMCGCTSNRSTSGVREPPATAVMCGTSFRLRTGVQFVESVRALGLRVVSGPELRRVETWAALPRRVRERFVLVVSSRSVGMALEAVQQAVLDARLDLVGIVSICDLSAESEAIAELIAAGGKGWHCQRRVVPSMSLGVS